MKHNNSLAGFSFLKLLVGLLAVFVVLVVAVLIFLTFFLSPTAKWAANSKLPEILGTDASVESIDIKLWSGDIEITGVKVADPTGEEGKPELFSLGRVFLDIDTASLFSDTIIIREVTVESPAMNASRGKDGKFSFEALKVMQPAADEKPVEEEPSEAAAFTKAIQIDKISISDLAASFLDEGDPKGTNQYSIKNFNFLTENITVNPGKVVAALPPGVDLPLIQLSDAIIEYQTNKSIPDPDQPVAEEKPEAKSEVPPAETAQAPEQSTVAEEVEPIFVHKFALTNFTIHYKDTPPDQKKIIDLNFTDFYITAEDFGFDPSNALEGKTDEVFTAKLGLKIDQTGEGVSPAVFTGVAKSTVIGSGIPVNAGTVQLTGFELATVKPLVPTGTQSAIGGPAFDLFAKWFVAPDKLEAIVRITSSANVVTNLEVGGTPDNPQIKGTKALLNILNRPGALIGNLAGNALKGSLDIVSGATDAAGNLAKGAGDTVLGFGKGLLNTGKGLLTGDLKEAGKGLEEATVGTVKNATNTVNKTAESAVVGVGKAVDSTTGGAQQKDWRVSNSKRHDDFEKGAQEWLENDQFPPTSAELKSDMSKEDPEANKTTEAKNSGDNQSAPTEASNTKTEGSSTE